MNKGITISIFLFAALTMILLNIRLDMDLKNLDVDKIVNNIPKDFEYKEKCTEKDWIKLLDKKVERKRSKMFKVIAKQDYKDKRAELIEEYKDKEIKYDELGNALVEEGDIYIISNPERAKQIEESGLADVIEIKEEREKKEETKQKE